MGKLLNSTNRLPVTTLAERWMNQIRYRIKSPQFVISILLLVVLFYLIVVPLYGIVNRTVTWDEADTRLSRDVVSGQHTLFHWKNVLSGRLAKKFFYEPLMHALFTGLVAAVLALLVGGILSWLVTRTDMPGKQWLRPILTIPYIIPSFAIALAWGTLFRSPNVGGHQGLFEVAFGMAPPAWLSYGPVPIILTMVIHYFPFALLLVSGAMTTIDTQLEEGAELLGASRFHILRKITFPIVAPAFMAAFVLTFGKIFTLAEVITSSPTLAKSLRCQQQKSSEYSMRNRQRFSNLFMT